MSDRELMQQALETMTAILSGCERGSHETKWAVVMSPKDAALSAAASSIEALRARLAEPDDKPVAFAGPMPGTSGFTMVVFNAQHVPLNTPLYTRPVARKVQP